MQNYIKYVKYIYGNIQIHKVFRKYVKYIYGTSFSFFLFHFILFIYYECITCNHCDGENSS